MCVLVCVIYTNCKQTIALHRIASSTLTPVSRTPTPPLIIYINYITPTCIRIHTQIHTGLRLIDPLVRNLLHDDTDEDIDGDFAGLQKLGPLQDTLSVYVRE